jgi:penicillin-binding protein 2
MNALPSLVNPELAFFQYRRRLQLAGIVAALLFTVLFGRLAFLQVFEYERYHALAEDNRIALLPAVPARGAILDRNGEVLAGNYTAHILEITPSKTGGLEDTLTRLGEIIEIDATDLKRFRRRLAETRDFESVPIRLRLSETEIARFAVNRYRFPGVEMKARRFRSYPLGEAFSHVIGYIGRINEKDLTRLEEEGLQAEYRGSDHIGKLGVEKRYEGWLHGHTGIERVEVDSGGHAVRVLSRTPAAAGYDLRLHLDAALQEVANEVLADYRGALVALDPNTGGVLAMVSRPGFDPNLFIDGIDSETWQELNDEVRRPLINRALRGIYPPGSTIKPFMALAGLELGYRRAGDSISDPGYFSLPGSSHRYRDWRKAGHGSVDLKKSVVQSCDTYYYRLAHEMGIRKMKDFLSRFGFGQPTQIDLDGELSGLLPSPEWKQQRFRQPWWPGETVIAGIGQGYMLATPMQLVVATMAIANGGTVYRPQIVHAWYDPATRRTLQYKPQVLQHSILQPGHLDLVRQAMVEVTRPGGTAAGAGAGAAYAFAGKTGTAQVKGIRQGERYNERAVAARYRDHALFIAYAPAEAPRIAVAVMVENGGHGGSTAAPMARKVIDYWLLGKRPQKPVQTDPPSEQAAAPPDPETENPDAETDHAD